MSRPAVAIMETNKNTVELELLPFDDGDTDEGLPLYMTEEDDGSVTIEWDMDDPRAIEWGINDWTTEDWSEALEEAARRVDAEEAEEE